MVKGISRQVIGVRSPDPKLFEQANFIVRENALGKDGMSDRAILRQAQQAAGSYVPSGKQRCHFLLSGPLWAAGGALATGLLWLLTAIV